LPIGKFTIAGFVKSFWTTFLEMKKEAFVDLTHCKTSEEPADSRDYGWEEILRTPVTCRWGDLGLGRAIFAA